METPKERSGGKDYDESDQDAAEDLHLSVNAAGAQIIRYRGIEPIKRYSLEDVNAANCQPSQEEHQETLDNLLDAASIERWKSRDKRYHDQQPDGKEYRARRLGEILTQPQGLPLRVRLFPVQQAEQHPVNSVAENHYRRNEEDAEQPVLLG
jgi:hypothetical protein